MRAGAILAFLVLFAGAAQAQQAPQPLDRVLPEIRRSTPGRFYDAEGPIFDADGRAHYRIKWMTPDGRIVWFDADARTGRVMGEGQRFQGHPQGDFDDRRWRGYDNDDRGNRGDGNWKHGDHDGNRGDWNRGNHGGDWNRGNHGGGDHGRGHGG